jgi:site-specific DNA recombinase
LIAAWRPHAPLIQPGNEQSLQRELSHVDKAIERLLTAYHQELCSLEQFRERMPMLRQREQALRAQLQAIADQANDRAAFLRLAETRTAFLTRLRSSAENFSVIERQKVVRLQVKEILVGEHTITIRHSVPIPLFFKDHRVSAEVERQLEVSEEIRTQYTMTFND